MNADKQLPLILSPYWCFYISLQSLHAPLHSYNSDLCFVGSDDDDELEAEDTNDTDLPTNLSLNARVPDRDNPPPPPPSAALQDSFKTNNKTSYPIMQEFLPVSSRSPGGVAENLSIAPASDPAAAVASKTNTSQLPSALALDTRKLLTLLPASDQIKRGPPDERAVDSNLVFQTTTTTTTTAHLSPEVLAQLGYTTLLAQANQRAHNNQLSSSLLHEIGKTSAGGAPTSRLPQLKDELARRHLQPSQGAMQLPAGLACFVPDARTREALLATHMMASEQSPENLSLHDKNS